MSTRLQEQVDLITDVLEKSPESGASCLIESMSPAEIARVIESLPGDLRTPLWFAFVTFMGDVLKNSLKITERELAPQLEWQ